MDICQDQYVSMPSKNSGFLAFFPSFIYITVSTWQIIQQLIKYNRMIVNQRWSSHGMFKGNYTCMCPGRPWETQSRQLGKGTGALKNHVWGRESYTYVGIDEIFRAIMKILYFSSLIQLIKTYIPNLTYINIK
jgi:hypothetical protein